MAFRAYRARVAAKQNALGFAVAWAEKRPSDPAARQLLATGLADAGRIDDAIAEYESLLTTSPDDTVLLNNLAVLYQKKGDPRAIETARKVYEADRRHPAFVDTYGWILLQQGNPKEALGLFRRAKLLAPDVPEIRYHMAVALNALGRKTEALEELHSAFGMAELFEGADEARKLLGHLADSGKNP